MARRLSVALVLVALAGSFACRHEAKEEPSASAAPAPAAGPSAAPAAAPGWPTGDSLRASLPADPGAVSLTKSLFRNGDVVLEQRWPDGTHEHWWYPRDGQPHYIGRDGKEIVGVGENGP